MRKIYLLLTVMLSLVMSQAHAQERQIAGKITSTQDNLGIPGVSVVVEGTTIGTTTDVDGNYKLTVPANAKTIRISGVGMKTKTIDLTASNNYDVPLEPDVLKLDEVVVTALGISREKKALGYATQTVSGDDVNNQRNGNAISELEGKVSGLTVINSAGDPGAGSYIRLRGVTSLTGNNQPLFVVDGIPIDNSINNYDPTFAGFQAGGPNGNTTGGVTGDNRAMDINPDDIASITVLKGPAATALYGINAASGAIIITTKKGGGSGHAGPTVTFSTSTSWDKVNKLPKLQNIYGQGSDGVYYGPDAATSNKKFSWGPPVSQLSWTGNSTVWDPHGDIVLNTDPSAKIPVTPYNPEDFFQTGSTENNDFAVGGGTDKSGYRMSIGNVHTKGTIPLSKYDKTNFSLSGQTSFTSKFSASATVNYVKSTSDRVQQGSNISGVMLGLLRTPPTFDNSYGLTDAANNPQSYVLADGTQRNYRGGPGYDNPYWTVNRNPYTQNLDRVYGSTQLDYKLFDWLSLTYRVGGDVYSQDTKNAYDINSNQFSAGAIYLVDYFNKQFNSDFIINANHKFSDDLRGSLILGHNYFTLTSTNRFNSGSGFAVPTWFDLANSSSFLGSETEQRKRTMAYYGQAELDYKSQLFLTVSGRDETSSTLPADKNVFFYPSASLGWVFTEPLGLSDNKVFPFGKLRLSFAQVGKDAPIFGLQTYYLTSAIADGFTTGLFFPIGGVSGYSISSTINTLGNPNLKPEKTNSVEAGVDLTFVQNRISLSATYYHEKSTDVIFTVPIPYSTGWPAELLNAATITNHGIELTLNTTPVSLKNGFKWDVTFNWSENRNIVNDLYNGVQNLLISGFQNGAIYAVAGKPFGQIYGSTYVRSNPSDPNSPLLINDTPGDPGYGMPIVSTTTDVIGDVNPKWIGSVQSNFSWKGFSIGGQLEVRHGGDIWNGTRGALSYFGTSEETADRTQTKTFDGVLGHLDANGNTVHYATDGVSEISGAGGTNTSAVTLNQYYWQNVGSSFIGAASTSVEDGSYVRFRQINISYSFPKAMINKLRLANLSVTLFANNPFLWTKYTGVDPETSLGGPSNGQGLDYFNNPSIKSYGFRVNVGL